MTAKKTTAKRAKKTTAKRAKKTTAKAAKAAKAANDPPPLPPSMPGQQEHIPHTLDKPIIDIQHAALALDEARKAAVGWLVQAKSRKAVLESELKKHKIKDTYYDGVVSVVLSVSDPKEKLEVEVIDAHFPEATE